jgi:hypothetical protein
MRQKLAHLTFEAKIRKVGELIRLRQKIKTAASKVSEAALLASPDEAAAERPRDGARVPRCSDL